VIRFVCVTLRSKGSFTASVVSARNEYNTNDISPLDNNAINVRINDFTLSLAFTCALAAILPPITLHAR
jgi:hypothetical protein